jgi:hypothetical protein
MKLPASFRQRNEQAAWYSARGTCSVECHGKKRGQSQWAAMRTLKNGNSHPG